MLTYILIGLGAYVVGTAIYFGFGVHRWDVSGDTTLVFLVAPIGVPILALAWFQDWKQSRCTKGHG